MATPDAGTGDFTYKWNEGNPEGTDNANEADDHMRYIRADMGDRLNPMLYGFADDDESGYEGTYGVKNLLFYPQAASPTADANKFFIFCKDVSEKIELFVLDEDDNESQITSGGGFLLGKSTAPRPIMHNTTEEDADGGRESRLTAYGEQSGGERSTLGYIEFSHDGGSDDQKGKFRIVLNDGDDADAPSKCPIDFGNNGHIDVTASLSVLDEDAMDSDSATQLATQQSIKAYADNEIGGRGGQSSQVAGTSDITNTTGDWADMANMSITLNPTKGGNVLLLFSASIGGGGGTATVDLRFDVDGTPHHTIRLTAAGVNIDASLQWLETSLGAASHTFKVQWKDVSGTASQDGSSVGPRVFSAIELPS